ncbi:hypothetical protein Q427_00195 [Halomonas sp. BC04]|nr:hypothetical protein Q427_00195 [Halomonas sp. BC04]
MVGMLESSLLTAQQLGGRFSILTPGERWPKMIEETVYDLGLARRCLAIEAINIEDLKLPTQREEMHRRLAETLIRHQKRLNPDVTIIGGAAFAGLANSLPAQHNSRLVDCFEAAILQCQALMQLGGESTRIL